MVVLREKEIQKSSGNLFLKDENFDTVRGKNVIPLQSMKKEHIKILKQNKAILENDVSDMTTMMNPDLRNLPHHC